MDMNRVKHRISVYRSKNRGSLSAILNIDLDLDPIPMFASMEHMHMNRITLNIDLGAILHQVLFLTLS